MDRLWILLNFALMIPQEILVVFQEKNAYTQWSITTPNSWNKTCLKVACTAFFIAFYSSNYVTATKICALIEISTLCIIF